MRLGIGSYTYMWSIGLPGAQPERPMTALDLLAQAVELGVRLVQIGPNLPLHKLSALELDLVAGWARERNIELEVGTRGLDADHMRRYLAIATRVGASLLRTVPENEDCNEPSIGKISSRLSAILPDLAEAKVRLAVENSRIPAEGLAQLMEAIRSPWVGITLDTANSVAIPEGWRHVTRALAPHTMCLHIKDFLIQRAWHQMGFILEGRPAGKGQLDIPWLLETLRGAGVSPNVILELWPPEQRSLAATIALEHAWASESIQYLRQYIPD